MERNNFFKLIISIFLCLITLNPAYSEENSYKFGKVTREELEMTVYPRDSTAKAIILNEDGQIFFNFNVDNFVVDLELMKKIKILKQEGVEYATIKIPYYYKSTASREIINNLDAFAYNLEKGEIVKTKLDKKYIFDEKVNDNYHQMKFAIPNVKAGTVIEYKYVRRSPFYSNIPDWQFQTKIPVRKSRLEVVIPEYFLYNVDQIGYQPINSNETKINQTFSIAGNGKISSITCTSRKLTFEVENLPALEDDNHIWCVDDYLSGVRFELNGTQFPNDLYHSYTSTWKDIEKNLSENSDFVKNISKSNPYKDEIRALITPLTDNKSKIEAIYLYVKQKIRWNDTYAFFDNNPKEAIKNGIGNNAQINCILISVLNDAGFNAYAVMMSRRSMGRLPYAFPSLDKLNTYIVAVEDGTNTYYLDGSAYYGGLNMLPTDLMVDRARTFDMKNENKWVDLTSLSKNQKINIVEAVINPEGDIEGTLKSFYKNEDAYTFKKMFSELKDSTEYIEKMKADNNLEIKNISITNHKDLMSNVVLEDLSFLKKSDSNGDYLYINPLIFQHITSNPFTQSERKLPIEFKYPQSFQLNASIIIPDNYLIEELPKSNIIKLEEAGGKMQYLIKQEDNKIQLSYKFDLNQTIFPETSYSFIRDFWGIIASKNAEMIVLKKKN